MGGHPCLLLEPSSPALAMTAVRGWHRCCACSVYFLCKSWVWSIQAVMFSCCGAMSTLEYNIWKAIVSTACTDLFFFLFGGFVLAQTWMSNVATYWRIVYHYFKPHAIVAFKGCFVNWSWIMVYKKTFQEIQINEIIPSKAAIIVISNLPRTVKMILKNWRKSIKFILIICSLDRV